MKHLAFSLFLLGAAPLAARAQVGAAAPPIPNTNPALVATRTPRADTPTRKVKVVMAPNLFAAPLVTRPLKIAVYFGGGAGKGNSELLVQAAKRLKGATVVPITPAELVAFDLSQFDVLVFAGGSGSGQAKAIGPQGLANVRQFVKNGGGYLGICAGAYLACSNFPWSLGLMNARTRSQKWMRGGGAVGLELSVDGQKIFGDVKQPFPVRYNNGPVIEPDTRTDLPAYSVLATFRDELAEHGTPVGLMKDSPAAVSAQFGLGRVLTISPHFEGTKNAENILPTALVWLGEKTVPAK